MWDGCCRERSSYMGWLSVNERDNCSRRYRLIKAGKFQFADLRNYYEEKMLERCISPYGICQWNTERVSRCSCQMCMRWASVYFLPMLMAYIYVIMIHTRHWRAVPPAKTEYSSEIHTGDEELIQFCLYITQVARPKGVDKSEWSCVMRKEWGRRWCWRKMLLVNWLYITRRRSWALRYRLSGGKTGDVKVSADWCHVLANFSVEPTIYAYFQ